MRIRHFLLVVLLLTGGCARQPRNLLLITMDTTRADHLGCYGHESAHTPNIDRVARKGTVFRRAFTAAPITGPSHASILSGMYPPFHRMRDNNVSVLPDGLVTLAEIFRADGYRTAAFVAAYPVIGRFGFSQGFDYFSDRFDAAPGEVFVTNLPNVGVSRRPGDVVAREFAAWLDENDHEPFFVWLHFYDVHKPIDSPAEFLGMCPDSPYDGEIAFLDDCIGTVLGAVHEHGLDDSTGVILVADHGEGLGDHGEETHALLSFNSTLHVPLIFRFPWLSMQEREIRRKVSTVDIVPTVVEEYGLQPVVNEAPFQGISLAGLIEGKEEIPSDRKMYFECFLPFNAFGWYPTQGVIHGPYKYIEGPQAAVFEIDEDFGETRELGDATLAAELGRELEEFLPELEKDRPEAGEGGVSGESLEQLQALGYVAPGGGADPELLSPEEKKQLPDPRWSMDFWRLYNAAINDADEQKWTRCLDKCRRLLEKQPGNSKTRLLMARALTGLGDFDGADTLYGKLIEDPDNGPAMNQALHYYLFTRRNAVQARYCADALLALWPKDADVLVMRARAELLAEDIAAAERTLKSALEIDEKSRDALIELGTLMDARRDAPAMAEVFFQRTCRHHPFDPKSLYSYGVFLLRHGRTDEAVEYFSRASAFAPGGVFDQAHLAMALIAGDRGEPRVEERYLEELLLKTGDPEMHHRVRLLLDDLRAGRQDSRSRDLSR